MEHTQKKLLILLPDGKIHGIRFGRFTRSFREAPVTATHLAALVPKELNFHVRVIDESVSRIDFKEYFDLVAISVLTGTSERAYEIADAFKAKHNSTIILGGVHISLKPEEAAEHADSIVQGYAEESWPQLLRDYVSGKLQKSYKEEKTNGRILKDLPIPRRDLQKKLRYNIPGSTFATRGCRFNCDFCTTAASNTDWRVRPVEEVIADIKTIPNKYIAFNDVNIINDREYALELFEAMKGMNKIWGGLATVHIANDPELLEAMSASGCRYLLIGLESVNKSSLIGIQKGFNTVDGYRHLVETLHDLRISIQGCFIFGLDSDGLDIFDSTVDLVNDLRIDIPRYAIYTPYPGTPAFDRMKEEDRLLHTRWKYYDTQHVVFQPKNMSVMQLEEGFKKAYKDTFTFRSNYRRSIKKGSFSIINFMGNTAYKLYVKRLYKDKDRFPLPLEEMEKQIMADQLINVEQGL